VTQAANLIAAKIIPQTGCFNSKTHYTQNRPANLTGAPLWVEQPHRSSPQETQQGSRLAAPQVAGLQAERREACRRWRKRRAPLFSFSSSPERQAVETSADRFHVDPTLVRTPPGEVPRRVSTVHAATAHPAQPVRRLPRGSASDIPPPSHLPTLRGPPSRSRPWLDIRLGPGTHAHPSGTFHLTDDRPPVSVTTFNETRTCVTSQQSGTPLRCPTRRPVLIGGRSERPAGGNCWEGPLPPSAAGAEGLR